MGLLKLFFVYVVSVSVVNSQNTHNETELMLNRTKRYHEPPIAVVNRPKKDSNVSLKSYITENSTPTPKFPVIPPKSMNLRLDNGVNTLPRKIVQLNNQPKNIIVPTNNLIPLNTYKLEARTGEQNIPSNTRKLIDNHEENIKRRKHKHTGNVLTPKHEFYEDDIDNDEVNNMDELKMVNIKTPMKHSDADKVQKNKTSHESGNIGIPFEHGYNLDINMHHGDSITNDNITCVENKLKTDIPVILNITKTDIKSEIPKFNKTTSNISELILKSDTIKQHEQQENRNKNKVVSVDIDDASQYCVNDLHNTPNYTEAEEVTVAIITKDNDEDKGIDANTSTSLNAKPVKDVQSETAGNIVIKNRTFEEVRGRSKTKAPNIGNQGQDQEIWSTPQICYNREWSPYNYYYDQCPNPNYKTNEDRIYKPDFTYTKPPYQYPYEDTINLSNVMDMKPNYYEMANKIPDYKDLVWRKWKDVEICIQTSKIKPVSVEIEQKPMSADDNVVSNGLKTPIFYGFSQADNGSDDYIRNNNMVAWYCYPSYKYAR